MALYFLWQGIRRLPDLLDYLVDLAFRVFRPNASKATVTRWQDMAFAYPVALGAGALLWGGASLALRLFS